MRESPSRHRRRIALVLIALAAVMLGGTIAGAKAARDETILISRQSAANGGAGADDGSARPVVSADGRYVAFESEANNLSLDDDDGVTNVFVRDTETDKTTLVSRRSVADDHAGANGSSFAPSLSADGRYVAFQSEADNLSTAAHANAATNVFLRDTQTDTTTLVSRQSGVSGPGADGSSFAPSLSADGRSVSFESEADNLSTADDDTLRNVFLRDIQNDTTTLVSRQSVAHGGAGADGNSSAPSISVDGRFVAFASIAGNLSTADDDLFQDVFVHDAVADTTTLVSRQSVAGGGLGADWDSFDASISADGRFVAFGSGAYNLSGADGDNADDVFLRDVLGTECEDGLDNDSDGRIDHPSDPSCDSAADDDESDAPPPSPPPPAGGGGGAPPDSGPPPDGNGGALPDGDTAPQPGPADVDGDGLRDAFDRCPQMPGIARGCPEVERFLTLKFKDRAGVFKGSISSSPDTPECEGSHKVKVFEKKRGSDPKVGSDWTDAKGKYAIDARGRDGRYYAKVKDADQIPLAFCLGGRSKLLRLTQWAPASDTNRRPRS